MRKLARFWILRRKDGQAASELNLGGYKQDPRGAIVRVWNRKCPPEVFYRTSGGRGLSWLAETDRGLPSSTRGGHVSQSPTPTLFIIPGRRSGSSRVPAAAGSLSAFNVTAFTRILQHLVGFPSRVFYVVDGQPDQLSDPVEDPQTWTGPGAVGSVCGAFWRCFAALVSHKR